MQRERDERKVCDLRETGSNGRRDEARQEELTAIASVEVFFEDPVQPGLFPRAWLISGHIRPTDLV